VHRVKFCHSPNFTEQDLRFTLLLAGALDRRLSTTPDIFDSVRSLRLD
jgi:hypothetical protein